jgi:hypothetical protein
MQRKTFFKDFVQARNITEDAWEEPAFIKLNNAPIKYSQNAFL